MTNHIITGRQIQCLIIMFWGGSLVILSASGTAKQDVWIAILMATLMILPNIALYSRIIKLYPGLNLFEIFDKICGKYIGKTFSLIYTLFALHLGSMVVNTFNQFIHILNTPETPVILTGAMVTALAVWAAKNGPENIARVAKYTWPILLFSVAGTFVIAIREMDINNLLPIMETDMKSLLNSATSYYALPLGEAILCLCFFSSVDKNTKASGIFLKSLIWFIGLLLLIAVRNVLILGLPSVIQFYFPSYQAVSVISVGEFFTRIEVLIGVNLMLAGFIKICVCLYCSSLGLTKLFNFSDQKQMVVPCALIIFTLSEMLTKNSIQYLDFTKIYPIYVLPFEVIIPVIVWIVAEIRNKVENSGKNKNQESSQTENPSSNPTSSPT
jgi:spore germination protein KB